MTTRARGDFAVRFDKAPVIDYFGMGKNQGVKIVNGCTKYQRDNCLNCDIPLAKCPAQRKSRDEA